MTLSIGAHTSKGYTFNNYTTTDAITTTSGSCIIVAVAYWQGMFPVPVITDSYNNTWIEVGDVYQSSGIPGYAHFYKNENGIRGANHTFTETKTAGVASIWVLEVLGIHPIVDVVNIGKRDTSSPYESNTITTYAETELLVCFGVPHTSTSPSMFTWGDDFVSTGDDITSKSYWPGTLATRQVTSAGVYQASATISSGTVTGGGFQILGIKEYENSAIVKTGNWKGIVDAKIVDTGIAKPVKTGWIVVNGEWKKWWPPPP